MHAMLGALVVSVVVSCPAETFCLTTGQLTSTTLFGASIRSDTDAWAVGDVGTALHWDGTSWSASPTGSTDSLHSVVALGPADVWASGNETVLHFDGTWRTVLTATNRFLGPLFDVSPGVVWLLDEVPQVLSGGQARPLPAAVGALRDGGMVISAAACGPDDVWSLVRSPGSGLILHHWNGASVQTLRRPHRVQVGTVVCVGGVAWVSTDDSLLACTPKGCSVEQGLNEPRLLRSKRDVLVISGDRLFKRIGTSFHDIGAVPPEAFGGAAVGSDRALVYGRSGVVEWVGPKAPRGPGLVRLGNVRHLAASGGRAWVASERGLFEWDGASWKVDETVPWKRWVDALSATGSDLWAAADGRAFRKRKGQWAAMSDASMTIRGIVAFTPTDVVGFGQRTLRRWNGRTWSDFAPVKPDSTWQQVTGDGTSLYALARGPRPEDTDGPSTGLPDDVFMVEPGVPPRWVAAAGRPEHLAIVGGELWAVAPHGSTSRWSGGRWVALPDVSGRFIVPTARGAVVLSNSEYALEWDGTRATKLILRGPAGVGASDGTTVWLGGDDTALRRSTP